MTKPDYYIKVKYTSLRNWQFLKDIFVFAVAAFGGPQAHIAMMLNLLVHRRNYITEKELMELIALCQLLPGPTSTQTLTAIGYKRGGPLLAFLTVMIWTLPAALVMTGVVLMFAFLDQRAVSTHFLTFIQPVAVGFIAYAGYNLGRTVINSYNTWFILLAATAVTILIRSPWVPPLALVGGGLVSNFFNRVRSYHKPQLTVKWGNLVLFFGIMIGAVILGAVTKYKPVLLFENIYRFGSLVFGGGYVLIPMMYEQFVIHKAYMTSQEFLTGVGIMQALPGPVFSFSTYIGGMALQDMGMTGRVMGAVIGTIGIFLPGTLLIFFVYPFWKELKKFTVIKRSLEGINAATAGLIAAAAVILYWAMLTKAAGQHDPFPTNLITFIHTPESWVHSGIVLLTFALLQFTRIPAPVIVGVALLGGFLF